LDAYRRVRQHLVEELGVDPGPRLRALEARVLAQDAGLTGRARLPGRGTSPGLSGDLVGRSDDLAALTMAIERRRLVTLVGTAGVGKTRLAVEAAARSAVRDGAWMALLETARVRSSI
jgi:hypothetical protein